MKLKRFFRKLSDMEYQKRKQHVLEPDEQTLKVLAENNSLAYEPSLKHVIDEYKQQQKKTVSHTMKKRWWIIF